LAYFHYSSVLAAARLPLSLGNNAERPSKHISMGEIGVMKYEVLTQVFVLFSLLFLFGTPAVAVPVFVQWGGEKIVKEMDRPDTTTFQRPDRNYLDVL